MPTGSGRQVASRNIRAGLPEGGLTCRDACGSRGRRGWPRPICARMCVLEAQAHVDVFLPRSRSRASFYGHRVVEWTFWCHDAVVH